MDSSSNDDVDAKEKFKSRVREAIQLINDSVQANITFDYWDITPRFRRYVLFQQSEADEVVCGRNLINDKLSSIIKINMDPPCGVDDIVHEIWHALGYIKC